MSPSDLLLLDEPTNHLDLEGLARKLVASFPGALLIIAHDRAFLDGASRITCCTYPGAGALHKGNYTAFERFVEELERQQAMATAQAQVAHIQQFVDRFRAKASKAKQVQSRIKV